MANLSFDASIGAILLVFYLYLLVRPQYVRRQFPFLIGAGAIVLNLLLIGILVAAGANRTVIGIFAILLNTIALLGGLLACYGGTLPGGVEQMVNRTSPPPMGPPPTGGTPQA